MRILQITIVCPSCQFMRAIAVDELHNTNENDNCPHCGSKMLKRHVSMGLLAKQIPPKAQSLIRE